MYKINLTAERKSELLQTREYRGYGQILKISYDGFENIVRMEPEDPVLGVQILYAPGHSMMLVPPKFLIQHKEEVMKNLSLAEEFCKEFEQRKSEILFG